MSGNARFANGLRGVLALTAALCVLGAARAAAQDAVRVDAQSLGDHGRITMIWPDALSDAGIEPAAEVTDNVLVMRFPRTVRLDPSEVAEGLPDRAALVRLDPDGRALRIALTREVRPAISRSYNYVAVDLVDPGAPDPAAIVSPREIDELRAAEAALERAEAEAARAQALPPRLPLHVRVAEAAEYARIMFDWTETVAFDLESAADGVVLRFERDGAPDLSRLRVDPPRGVVDAVARHDADRLQVAFTLEPGKTARAWSDGARVILDVMDAGADMDSAERLAALAISLRAAADGETTDAPVVPPMLRASADPDDAAPAAEEAAAPDASGEEEAAADAVEEAESAAHDGESEDAAAEPHEEPSDDATAHAALEDIPLVHTRAFEESGDVEAMTRDPYEFIEADPAPPPAVADPMPESGVVRAEVEQSGAEALVSFPWEAPVGAAAFRRGDTVWLVFDAPAALDLAEVRRANARHFIEAETVSGEAFSAARILTPSSTQVSVVRDGSTWTFSFGEAASAPPRPAGIERRADENTAPHLFADLPTVTAVHHVPDAEAGDMLTVATALGPAQGLPSRRTFLEITALASSHGLAFERAADGVTTAPVPGEGVIIERDRGLALSGAGTPVLPVDGGDDAAPPKPGFIDFEGWSVGPTEFARAHDRLARRVASGPTPAEDRIALARLLVAHELGPEALGVLRIAQGEDPRLLDDPNFRALRGVANVLAGRFKAAETDLNAPPIASDRAAAPWRGYVAAHFGDWREARRQFNEGAADLAALRVDWRGRFLVATADAALELNDLPGARRAVDEAYASEIPSDVRLEARLAEARFFAASGEPRRALAIAAQVGQAGYEPLEAAALFEAVRLNLELGEMTSAEAIDQLEALRLRWRGDEVELEIVRTLGALYMDTHQLRLGMQLMKSAAARFPESPVARRLYTDMNAAFRRLYLDGEADDLDPIEALALWYEFNDLTPVGADGDRMLRRLADRLIDFDLLEQAAELLAHQVDNRLRGVARAQVATDLAAIYLMDGRPEAALDVLRKTRVAGTPRDLVASRRLLEARALADLTRYEHALELLDTDRSDEALNLKADIAWEAHMWARAAVLLEASAGETWRGDSPLPPPYQSAVLRAAVAYSLTDNAEGVQRLVARFGPKMADGPHAASWRTVTSEPDVDGVVLRDLASRIAESDTLDAFLEEFRQRRAAATETAALASAASPS